MRQPRSGKQHQASHWEDQSQMTSISTWTGTKSGHALLVDRRLQHIETVFPSFFIVHILFSKSWNLRQNKLHFVFSIAQTWSRTVDSWNFHTPASLSMWKYFGYCELWNSLKTPSKKNADQPLEMSCVIRELTCIFWPETNPIKSEILASR